MNASESKVASDLRDDGWNVLNRGAPDLIAWRVSQSGQVRVRLIEVKSEGDRLRPE